jgi:uncharacterized protein
MVTIDCHYHLEERLLTVNEMIERMDAAGVDRIALMASVSDPIAEPPRLLVKMLHFMLVSPLSQQLGPRFLGGFTRDGDLKLNGKIYRVYPHPDNQPVFDVVKKWPGRFLAWVFVRPDSSINPVEELAKWKDHPGFVGVKAHPFWHRYEPGRLLPVAEALIPLGKPLLIHAGYGAHGDFLALARQAPGLKLILAHAGFPGYKTAWKAIKEMPNIFVDVSQTSYVSDDITRKVVDYLGARRCLFGTDGPHGFHDGSGKFDYGYIKRRIERLFPLSSVQERILGQNFADITQI